MLTTLVRTIGCLADCNGLGGYQKDSTPVAQRNEAKHERDPPPEALPACEYRHIDRGVFIGRPARSLGMSAG
jgi:hypothetical protein